MSTPTPPPFANDGSLSIAHRGPSSFQDPKNDILIRFPASGLEFSYRKTYLAGASQVFEDMFEDDSKATGPRETTNDGQLQVISLDDAGEQVEAFEAFLQFAHPRLESPELTKFEQLKSICTLADKYDAPGIAHAALAQAAPTFLGTHAPDLLALAIMRGSVRCAALALDRFDSADGKPTFARAPFPKEGYDYAAPRSRLSDMSVDLYVQVCQSKARLYYALRMVQDDILDPDLLPVKGWAGLCRDLKTDSSLFDDSGEPLLAWLSSKYKD